VLASAALVAGWAPSTTSPSGSFSSPGSCDPDFRIFYVAAEAGCDTAASIYDLPTLRALSSSFPPGQNYIDPALPFINPPVFAWLIAPLTAFPLPVAYRSGAWCPSRVYLGLVHRRGHI